MSKLLPEVLDPKHYSTLFAQDNVWEKAIDHLTNKHRLTGTPERAKRGSHIVYRVGDSWIKIMAPIFAKDMAYEIAGLESIYGKLSVQTPQIMGLGKIEDWPYVILSSVEGERIGAVWGGLTQPEKVRVACDIARVTKELQRCPARDVVKQRGDWKKFIQSRLNNVVAHHQSKNLNQQWLNELPKFLSRFDAREFIECDDVFLHADLTGDHFLVVRRGGEPTVSGVIDLADCRVGHPEYDIPATAAFIFKGDSKSLREYLIGLGYEESELNQRFSEKILAWTCLHFFSDLNNYFKSELLTLPPGDFSALARSGFKV